MIGKILSFFQDLFKGIDNKYWELGRIIVGIGMSAEIAAVAHNIIKGDSIDLMALGGGIAAIYGGAAALIFAKDQARTNAVATAAVTEAAIVQADRNNEGG